MENISKKGIVEETELSQHMPREKELFFQRRVLPLSSVRNESETVRIRDLEMKIIYRILRVLRKGVYYFKDDLSRLIIKAKCKEREYFWKTHVSIQEFIVFHCDIFKIAPTGQIGYVSYEEVQRYGNNSCNSKVPSQEITLNLEKQCLRKICKVICSGFNGSIYSTDLTALLSKTSERQRYYLRNMYSTLHDFIYFHWDIFTVENDGLIRCIPQQMLKPYLKNMSEKKFFRSENKCAYNSFIALPRVQNFAEAESDPSYPQETKNLILSRNEESHEDQEKVTQASASIGITEEFVSDPNYAGQDKNFIDHLSTDKEDFQSLNANTTVSVPVRSFSAERQLVYAVQQALMSRVSYITEDLTCLLTNIPEHFRKYFLKKYCSVNGFITFHKDIFKIQKNNQILSLDRRNIREYLKTDCNWKVSFPDSDLLKEKQCVKRFSKILNSASPLHVHINDPNLLYTKLTRILRLYISKKYTLMQNFIKFHSEIFSVDSDGYIYCSSEKVDSYLQNITGLKLKAAQKLLTQKSDSCSFPDDCIKHENGADLEYIFQENCLQHDSKEGKYEGQEESFRNIKGAEVAPYKKMKATQYDVLPPTFSGLQTSSECLFDTSGQTTKGKLKDVATQTTSTGPVLSMSSFHEA